MVFYVFYTTLNKQPFEVGLENSSPSNFGKNLNLAFLNNQKVWLFKYATKSNKSYKEHAPKLTFS